MLTKKFNSFRFFEKPELNEEFKILPAGVYTVNWEGMLFRSPSFTPKESTEKYIEPKTSEPYIELCKYVNKFFNKKLIDLYKDLQYLNKTGIICHGTPGTGKTASIDCLMQIVAKKYGAIVLYINSQESILNMKNLVENLRNEVKEDYPIVFVVDECENHFTNYNTENEMLHFLDGYKSKNNVMSIFITNKLEAIPPRFTERPSRIKAVIEFSKSPFEVLKQVLTEKIPEKYHQMIDINKLAFEYSEAGETIDKAKNKVIEVLEDKILQETVLENAK